MISCDVKTQRKQIAQLRETERRRFFLYDREKWELEWLEKQQDERLDKLIDRLMLSADAWDQNNNKLDEWEVSLNPDEQYLMFIVGEIKLVLKADSLQALVAIAEELGLEEATEAANARA